MSLFWGSPNIEKLHASGDTAGLIKALAFRRDWRVRCRAADALGEVRDDGVLSALVEAAADAIPDVRRSALAAIIRHGRPAIPVLLQLLRSSCPDVRLAAARALGDLGDGPIQDALEPLLRDPQPDVRRAAAAAMHSITTRAADAETRRRVPAALDRNAEPKAQRSAPAASFRDMELTTGGQRVA